MRVFVRSTIVLLLPAVIAFGQAPVNPNNPGGAPQPGQFGGPGPQGFRGPPPNAMFSAIDVDGDGVITKAELRRAIVQLKKLDADNDGNITLAEVSPFGGPGGPGGDPAQFVQTLMANDRNNDRQLTPDEVPDNLKPMLQDADTDKNNVLTWNELNAVAQNMQNRVPGGPGAGPWNNQPGALAGQPDGGNRDADSTQMLGRLLRNDRNGDGRLSANELPRKMRGDFKASDDLDGDGSLSPDELQAVVARMGDRARALGAGDGQDPDDERGDNRRPRNRARDNE
jgi:Ca2+-binding EF-hand superfamily protein